MLSVIFIKVFTYADQNHCVYIYTCNTILSFLISVNIEVNTTMYF